MTREDVAKIPLGEISDDIFDVVFKSVNKFEDFFGKKFEEMPEEYQKAELTLRILGGVDGYELERHKDSNEVIDFIVRESKGSCYYENILGSCRENNIQEFKPNAGGEKLADMIKRSELKTIFDPFGGVDGYIKYKESR